ncbi:MAG: serine protease [Patescibacteria group bacterium]|nr:serine protease [Patescibacteria group bacterium]MDE2116792.1 serine protease [Patescibacteria group bacterium]
MKKLIPLFFLIYLVPAVAFAAWWNPLTWFSKATSAPAVNTISRSNVAPASISATSTPSAADLEAEITNLQTQLENALNRIAVLSAASQKAAPAQTAPSRSVSSGISDAAMLAKVGPAIVGLNTATSSGSGVIIDAQGDILTNAHTIWTKDANNNVVGVADQVQVTFSDGSRSTATVIGMDEGDDLAIVELVSKRASSYISPDYGVSAKAGDRVYVLGYPATTADSSLGYGFATATVSQVGSDAITADVGRKPLDNGGALVDAQGGLIGIPHVTSCKILENMSDCLEYTVSAPNVSTIVPKLLAGMMLYKNKVNASAAEVLIQGELQGVYQSFADGSTVDFAVRDVTGDNSFADFDNRLGDDQNGSITRIYLTKLKLAAESMYQAVDFLKSQAYNLNVFLEDEDPSLPSLNSYERQTLTKIQSEIAAKVTKYESKVSLWSSKRNEYDAKIADPSSVSHNYLMEEGAFVENEATYLSAEKQWMLDTFSGENVAIF